MSDNIDKIIDRLLKGGPGSGKKGHTTQKHLEDVKGHMGSHHIMQYGDKGSAFSTAHRQGKSEVFHHPETDSYHVVSEGGGVKHLKDHENFKRLGAPYKGDPAAEAVSPTSHGTKPAGEGKYGVEGGKFTDPASEGASAAMSDNRKANTEKYLKQLKTSLSLERDPAERANFEKDIKDIEKELEMHKSIEALYHLKQLAETGRIKPKQKRNIRKGEYLEKKQGVPKGVDPAKHERCVMDVKADGKDKSSAFAICNANIKKAAERVEKILPLAAAKTAGRVVSNAIKPTEAGRGSDSVPGSPTGPSVAHGSGGAQSGPGPSAPKISKGKMKKSLFDRIEDILKGGPGSGRKGHFTDDGYEHESVFDEGSKYGSTQEKLSHMDRIKAAAEREEERAGQRIKERESTAKRGISRKTPKAPEKKTFLQRMGQKIIDAI